jgi:hypothetical protein
MIDLEKLESYLKEYLDTLEWNFYEVTKEEFLDFIMGNFGACLEQCKSQERAEHTMDVIASSLYYYQDGCENKFIKMAKEEYSRYDERARAKVRSVIELIEPDTTSSKQLIALLTDMYQRPSCYTKHRPTPTKQLKKEELIKDIIESFYLSSTAIKKTPKICVNITKKIFKKLPFSK